MPARKSQCENVREEPVFALGRLRLRLRFLNEEKWAAGGSGGPSRRSGLRSSGRRMGDKRRVACFPEPRSNRLTGLNEGKERICLVKAMQWKVKRGRALVVLWGASSSGNFCTGDGEGDGKVAVYVYCMCAAMEAKH